jgi:tetratricopeptide (TPR) repeat protein
MLGNAYAALGDAHKAIEYYEQALAIAREIGDRRSEGSGLGMLGNAYAALGDARKAIEYYEQALAIAREIGDKQSESIWIGNLGFRTDTSKNIDSGLQISQHIGDRRTEAYLICAIASKKRLEGSIDEAIRLFEQALKISEDIGDIYAKGQILDNMGNAYADLGNQEKAVECYLNAMEFSADEELTANISWNLATVYNEQEQYELAAKYMQITIDFEQKINHPNANADLEVLNKVRAKMQNIIKPEEEN